jgi:hypothetical protein
VPLFRVALMSALVGHWIANAIADPIEYASVGLRYDADALRPILFQSILAGVLLVSLTMAARLRVTRRLSHRMLEGPRLPLAALLATMQICLFVVMEITERIALGETYARAFHGGVLDAGFGIELVIAIASALALVALAMAVTRVVRSLLGRTPTARPSADRSGPREHTHVRAIRLLAGSGGVRAPPPILCR